MPNYDFHQLSPYDLELLVRDLLQAHWKVRIESFKTGPDWGIDLRYVSGPHRTIIQVKHYLRTGLAGLLRDLKAEGQKVLKLNPTRYLLATSLPLSPADKAAIVSAMAVPMLNVSDVLGAETLNNLLGLYPDVETRQYKLWLASTAVLERVLHNAEVTRSQFKVRQVYEKVKRYVPSNAYPEALRMINDHKVVIVAGPPGVGKTTLADLILYEHLERGYQAIEIQRDISEGETLFNPEKKQIFYFDDFMGATFLGDRVGAVNGVADRALLNFIAMVRASPNARLVMTTREHIYAAAFFRSERLRDSDLNDLRVLLNMPAYTQAQRGRILYNHVYFSDLPAEYRRELLRGDFFLKIVKHEKFNPRLIEWLSNFRRLKNIPVHEYQQFITDLLQDPSEIWRHAYEQEISDAGRSLLLTIYSQGGETRATRLQRGFGALHAHRAARYGFQTRPEDFTAAVREVANSFVKMSGSDSFKVIDPSVNDLMNSVLRRDAENALDIIVGAVAFDQILQVWKFAQADNSRVVLKALAVAAVQLAPHIEAIAVDTRLTEVSTGFHMAFGPSYEERLKIVIEMNEHLGGSAFLGVVNKTYKRLVEDWKTERSNINDAIDLMRTINLARHLPRQQSDAMRERIQALLLSNAQQGCRASELRELISILDTSDPESEAVEAAKLAYEAFRPNFQQDLSECKSSAHFYQLSEDLQYFRDTLGVDVARLLEFVEEEKEEFEQHEEAYNDQMESEWKDRYRDRRDEDHGLTQMFSSLRGHGE